MDSGALSFDEFDLLKVYYDCGQAPVTQMLHDVFTDKLRDKIEFAKAVKPEKYKLFQLADLVCSIKLTECKLAGCFPLTLGENKFFRGPRVFKHDILRRLKVHEI